MVFADDAHCTGLRTLLSHLLDEPDFGTDRQTVEGVIENTIPVEKDLAAIGGFDETRTELSPIFGDGLKDQAAAVWV